MKKTTYCVLDLVLADAVRPWTFPSLMGSKLKVRANHTAEPLESELKWMHGLAQDLQRPRWQEAAGNSFIEVIPAEAFAAACIQTPDSSMNRKTMWQEPQSPSMLAMAYMETAAYT